MNKEDYVGKTFIAFEFPTQRKNDGAVMFSYNEAGMKRFEGKEVEISEYRETFDSFVIKHGHFKWHYPADMVIEQLSNINEEDILKKLNKLFKQVKNS